MNELQDHYSYRLLQTELSSVLIQTKNRASDIYELCRRIEANLEIFQIQDCGS